MSRLTDLDKELTRGEGCQGRRMGEGIVMESGMDMDHCYI